MMMNSIRLICLFILVTTRVFAQDEGVELMLDHRSPHDCDLSVQADGSYSILTIGSDPYVFTLALKSDLDKDHNQLSFEYFCPTGMGFIQLHFYSLAEDRVIISVPDVGSTEGWVKLQIDISTALAGWGASGDNLRIDFSNASDLKIGMRNIKIESRRGGDEEGVALLQDKKKQERILESQLKHYLMENFENQISHVFVDDDQVKIKGQVKEGADLFLAEVSPYENITALKEFEFLIPIKPTQNSFDIQVDRMVKRHGFTQDRVLSKWVILKKNEDEYQISSHGRYADSIVQTYTYPFVKPSTKKGLGGFSANREAPISDLTDLGITSATVNIWVTHFFRIGPSPKNMPFVYMGKTYYVDKKEVERYDKTLLTTAAHGIEVSAILLVDKAAKAKDPLIGHILQHPDCDPAGIYSMPNLTTPEGVQYYAAILDFLAARYSRPDEKFGRIHHYIIHNEVNAGWVWTNAGDKTALVFMDLYHKSMRLTHNIARKYHASSKVFISLTHYWNWTSNPRFYHAKVLLEHLLRFSQAEGDFEWAIAYHPYPESLWEPKTWLDKKVSFDFDTQLITFKNTEVLDAWVKQPEVLFKGKTKRIVYLSENGTNSPTYSNKDLEEQAAGMAYALKKIKFLDGIDGIQYHNWQDNRGEGGLRIGLRRFPDDEKDPGGIKPVWEVYRAFGSEQEDDVFEKYKSIIGINSWDDIRFKGPVGKE